MSKSRYSQSSLDRDAHDFHGAFIWLIILIGVGFSDFIYFQMVSTMFAKDDPLMQGIAFAGAITTALSVLLLYYGKKKIFRPGKQVWTAWAFTLIEVVVMISNDILYFSQKNGNNTDAFLAFWKVFCPAAPVLSVVGWLLISYFDPSRALLHLKMSKADELESAEAKMHAEVDQSEIEFKLAMHKARMDAKYAALEDMQRHLAKAIQYEVQEDLRLGAGDMGRDIASSLTNTPISQLSQPRKPKVVDADPPQLIPAEAAHRIQYVDPHGVKPELDAQGVKPKSFGSLLGAAHSAMHNAIDKVIDGKEEPPAEQEGEKIKEPVKEPKQPRLPANPAKWNKNHWKLAQEIYPEDEYEELFDQYLGDKPSEEVVREDHIDSKKTKDLPEDWSNL